MSCCSKTIYYGSLVHPIVELLITLSYISNKYR
jgi:hypothetical protein